MIENKNDVLKIKADLLNSGLKIKEQLANVQNKNIMVKKYMDTYYCSALKANDVRIKDMAIKNLADLLSSEISLNETLCAVLDEESELSISAAAIMADMEFKMNNRKRGDDNE